MDSSSALPTLEEVCKDCGKCCETFGDEGTTGSLILLPWEFRAYDDAAREQGKDFVSAPHPLAHDEISGRTIIALYAIKTEPCIFYDGQCSIYEERPLICRSYPMYSTIREGKLRSTLIPCLGGDLIAAHEPAISPDPMENPSFLASIANAETANALYSFIKDVEELGLVRLTAPRRGPFVDIDIFLREHGVPVPSSTQEAMEEIRELYH